MSDKLAFVYLLIIAVVAMNIINLVAVPSLTSGSCYKIVGLNKGNLKDQQFYSANNGGLRRN